MDRTCITVKHGGGAEETHQIQVTTEDELTDFSFFLERLARTLRMNEETAKESPAAFGGWKAASCLKDVPRIGKTHEEVDELFRLRHQRSLEVKVYGSHQRSLEVRITVVYIRC